MGLIKQASWAGVERAHTQASALLMGAAPMEPSILKEKAT